MSKPTNISKILPLLLAFFVMGFCDLVGVSTSYVQRDFGLNKTMAGFIPSLVFLWFLLLSIPSALAMNRFGRKNIVLASNVVTIIGMVIPFINYNLMTCLTAFLLLGIGNTMLQVSLNPLLANVVNGKKLASSLTAGQFVKAISSFCGPIIAAFAATHLGHWQYIFPIYAVVTLISTAWLLMTHIEERPADKSSSLGNTLRLLGDKTILTLFLGIFFVVGTDVGINTVSPQLLIERCGLPVEDAGYGSSVYFIFRTFGAFIGSLILVKMSSTKFFRLSIAIAIAAGVALIFVHSLTSVLVMIALIGFFCASIFSIIYSIALAVRPENENEISGLMIMGVSGGAAIPPLMGFLADRTGSLTGSVAVIILCMAYLAYCSLAFGNKRK